MLLKRLILLFVLTMSAPAVAQTNADADRILAATKNLVTSLRVHGKPLDGAVFDPQEPPLYGTGFLVGTDRADSKGKYRIITAAHVLARDDMWEPRVSGVARSVYPSWLTTIGPVQAGVYRAVARHDLSDIAQIPYDLKERKPAHIGFDPIASGKRYFVVSFGIDDYGETVNEPYVREVKVVPASNLEAGLVALGIVSTGEHAFFKKSESGSPVFDMDGNAVGIVIKLRAPPAPSEDPPKIGIALPFAEVQDWLTGVKLRPVKDFVAVQVSLLPPLKMDETLYKLKGAAIFLGKYSARVLSQQSPKILADAPFGLDYLRSTIALFKEDNPEKVDDANASASKELEQPQALPLLGHLGAVNIRSHLPAVVPKRNRENPWRRIAYYAPIDAVVTSKFTVRISQVYRLAYVGDFFYWGIVHQATPIVPQ
jgi:hypothetical protein